MTSGFPEALQNWWRSLHPATRSVDSRGRYTHADIDLDWIKHALVGVWLLPAERMARRVLRPLFSVHRL